MFIVDDVSSPMLDETNFGWHDDVEDNCVNKFVRMLKAKKKILDIVLVRQGTDTYISSIFFCCNMSSLRRKKR